MRVYLRRGKLNFRCVYAIRAHGTHTNTTSINIACESCLICCCFRFKWRWRLTIWYDRAYTNKYYLIDTGVCVCVSTQFCVRVCECVFAARESVCHKIKIEWSVNQSTEFWVKHTYIQAHLSSCSLFLLLISSPFQLFICLFVVFPFAVLNSFAN